MEVLRSSNFSFITVGINMIVSNSKKLSLLRDENEQLSALCVKGAGLVHVVRFVAFTVTVIIS